MKPYKISVCAGLKPSLRFSISESIYRLEEYDSEKKLWFSSKQDIDNTHKYIDQDPKNISTYIKAYDLLQKDVLKESVKYEERRIALTSLMVESKEFYELSQSNTILSYLLAYEYGTGKISIDETNKISKCKHKIILKKLGGDGSSTQLNFLKKFQPPYNNDDVISATLNFIRNVDSENYFKIHPLKYTNLTLLNFIYNNSVTISHKAIRKQILHRYNLPPDFKGGKTEWFDSISSISKDINDLMFLRNYHPNKILEHSYQRTDSPLTIEKLLRKWLSFASKDNEEIRLPSGLSWKYKKTPLKLPDHFEQIQNLDQLSETAHKFNNCILDYYRELSNNNSQIFIIKGDEPAILELYVHEFNEISIGDTLHKNNVPLSKNLKQKILNDIRKAIINHQGRVFVKFRNTQDNLPF